MELVAAHLGLLRPPGSGLCFRMFGVSGSRTRFYTKRSFSLWLTLLRGKHKSLKCPDLVRFPLQRGPEVGQAEVDLLWIAGKVWAGYQGSSRLQ